MPLFGPLYFIKFLRNEPKESAEQLSVSWRHFLSADNDSEVSNADNPRRLLLNKPLLLKATVKGGEGTETWAITLSLGRAPHIAGGILEGKEPSHPRFSPQEIRSMVNNGLADITFESRKGEEGIISGRGACLYLNAKLDQIGRVKGKFKEGGDEVQATKFRKLLECFERSELGAEFLSFRSPQGDDCMAAKLVELDKSIHGLCGDVLDAMLASFDIPMEKWRKLTHF